MLFAPVLQEVAARMAGASSDARADPVRQAYRLRDAIELVRPDWVVTHYHPAAEADAVRTAGGGRDLVDLALSACTPVSELVELTRVLTALYPDRDVIASITGPAGMAAATEVGDDAISADPLDCGDVLAELVSAYVDAGARGLLVWETDVPADMASDVASAHSPIVRRLEMLGVPGVLCGAPALGADGYWAHALAEGGRRAMLVNADRFARGAAGCFAELWHTLTAPAAAEGSDPVALLLTDGPVPADCDMGLLSAAGARRVDRQSG